jgi:hypothetical protein
MPPRMPPRLLLNTDLTSSVNACTLSKLGISIIGKKSGKGKWRKMVTMQVKSKQARHLMVNK